MAFYIVFVHHLHNSPSGEDLTTEDMMSFYGCSDFAFNFNLIVKLKMDNLTGNNIKEAVSEKEWAKTYVKVAEDS